MLTDLNIFYSSLATVALIIILGFFLGKKKWINEATNKTLINLLLSVAMPCALFGAFPQEFHVDSLRLFLIGIGGGVAVFTVAILVSKLLFRKKQSPKNFFQYQFAFVFNNASFLGFPLVQAIFGQEGLIPYSGFIIVFNLALFSYGVMLYRQKFSWKQVGCALVNPNVVAVFAGTIFFVFSLKMPNFINSSIGYVGGMMTPLSLICIGFMLSRANLRKMLRKTKLVLTCVAQLTLGPLITYGVLSLLRVPTEVLHILLLIQALPTATSLGLFAEKYGGNTVEASELVAVSTVMSAVTLPIVLGLLLF